MLQDVDCEALLVWRRTGFFRVPTVFWFSGWRWTGDHTFKALSIFFESLAGLEPMRRTHLCLYGGPTQDSPGLRSCLESLQASGCQALTCSGGKCTGIRTSLNGKVGTYQGDLQDFYVSSPLLFAPSTVSFTMTVLHNAPLRRLTLISTALSPTMWTALLASLELPWLTFLEVEAKCPIPALADFLLRHHVSELRVYPSKDLIRPGMKLRLRPCGPIPSLATLDAPANLITNLMRRVEVQTLSKLTIRLYPLGKKQTMFPVLMDCSTKFPQLTELSVVVEDDVLDGAMFAVPDDKRSCSAKIIVFRLSDKIPNIVVSHKTCRHHDGLTEKTKGTFCTLDAIIPRGAHAVSPYL